MSSIESQKKELRCKLKLIRNCMDSLEKAKYDSQIFTNVREIINNSVTNIVFTYVSAQFEVDTSQIINYALGMGKKVAVPLCRNSFGEMDFYIINSLKELKIGNYNIQEPDPKASQLITDYSSGICLVPGLGFTQSGSRIGFGKGYYDRFLKNFLGTSIGLCYDRCICKMIPTGPYDVSVDSVVTQTKIY